jgi:hypothetical protein
MKSDWHYKTGTQANRAAQERIEMKKLSTLAIMLLTGAWIASCGSHKTFKYGDGQTGEGLLFGGYLLMEHINHPEGPTARGEYWMVTRTATAPANGPLDMVPAFMSNVCNDLGTMPVPLTPGTKPIDIMNFKITGPAGVITLPRMDGSITNPTISNDGVSGLDMFVGPVDPNLLPYDSNFTLSFSSPDGNSDVLHPASFYMPKAYNVTSPMVGKQNLTFASGQDVTFTWELNGDSDTDQFTGQTAFPFIQLGPGDTTFRTFFCPILDGKAHTTFTVPASVIAQLDKTGIVMMGKFTHTLAEFKHTRVDLQAIACNTSKYTIQ